MAAALVGCGVPTESKARAIVADDTLTAVTAPTTPPGPTARSVTLYFVDGDKLARVRRPVEQAPDLATAINKLLAGVTASEKGKGLLSSIPPETSALGVKIADGVATVNLSNQFKLEGDIYIQACAQVVYTVVANSPATRVRFQVEGKPTSPPTEKDGNLDIVAVGNYRSLAP